METFICYRCKHKLDIDFYSSWKNTNFNANFELAHFKIQLSRVI
jgi:uncharacterized protein YlaI